MKQTSLLLPLGRSVMLFLIGSSLAGDMSAENKTPDRDRDWFLNYTSVGDGDLILPNPEAVARRHGPFRTDASRGIPEGVRARRSPADDWLKPEPRAPERSPDTVLVKMRPVSETRRGDMHPMSAVSPAGTISGILGSDAILEVAQLVPIAEASSDSSAPMSMREGADRRDLLARHARERGLDRWHRVRLSADLPPDEAVRLLSADEAVEAAEPDFLFRLAGNPAPTTAMADYPDGPVATGGDPGSLPGPDTDPRLADQWHLEAAGIIDAWEHLKDLGLEPGGSRDVVVAVIDTGVDYTHPDLAANMWVNPLETANGQDSDGNGFIDDIHGVNVTTDVAAHRGNPMDDHGHGTHVAGIIAAQAKNNEGGVGVAYNVRIMAIKAAQYSGALAGSHIASGIYYAVENGADVINMSFGGYGRSILVEDALAVAFGQAVLVAAAGNDGRTNRPDCDPLNYGAMYPAAYNWVLGVMAQRSTPGASGDWLTGFSNWDCTPGDTVEYELMAPGSGIVSTLPNEGYSGWDGTSMATPVVAGAAALLRTRWPDKEVHSSRFIMGQLASTGDYKIGRVDPASGFEWSYRSLDAFTALTDTPTPAVTYLEHWIFDTPNIHPDNDDDGIVDAGETVELAIVLRNQWGRADNVTATLEAWADGAVGPDPFVTMEIDTVDYGSIGSFNQKDNEFIRDPEGAITGVANPFRFSVSPETPNDHIIPFRLTITATNGYDPEDATIYTREARFYLVVQKGRQVPPVIDEDMVWDKNSFWIVDRPVLIPEGVTVWVTEGAKIQFWSSDPSKLYSSGQQPFLQVEGTLLVEGTLEDPVHLLVSALYPISQLEIRNGSADAYSSIHYAVVDNPVLGNSGPWGIPLNRISHCHFQQLGSVGFGDGFWGIQVGADHITHSRFSRLGSSHSIYSNAFGAFTNNINTSLFDHVLFKSQGWAGMTTASNSVFLKNYNHNKIPFDQVSSVYRWGQEIFYRLPIIDSQQNSAVIHPTYDIWFDWSWLRGLTDFLGGIWKISNSSDAAVIRNYHVSSEGDWGLSMQFGELPDGSEVWMWDDGTPVEYFDWALGYPQEGQIYSYVAHDGWRTTDNKRLPFYLLPGQWSEEKFANAWNEYFRSGIYPLQDATFHSNAILNVWIDPNPAHWMRFSSHVSGHHDFPTTPIRDRVYLMPHNYWGTTSRTIIDAAIFDYHDNFNLPRIVYEPILETPSEETYPFVVNVRFDTAENIDVIMVGPELVTFVVTFNRDMDPAVHPQVSFGPSSPWKDYTVRPLDGGWSDARTWKGTARITPMTGDGWQYMRVAGAVAADDPWLVTGDDSERFRFQVNTSGVEAMNLFAMGGEGYVDLEWFQDDFELLAGYNIYRSTSANGPFSRLNAHLIPREQLAMRDTDVQPGQPYHYRFTVVLTDFSESVPSNTATATPLDTIPPVISHTPITNAPPNLSLTITADVTDNVAVRSVKLFFRHSGDDSYTQRTMTKTTGDRYSATLTGSEVMAPGIQYYIEASDGVSITRSGRAEAPHLVTVVDRPVITSVSPNNGPAEGGTAVTIAGSNFKEGAMVRFGSLGGVGVVVQSAAQITCIAPAHFPTAVDVTVTNPNGESHTLLNAFRFESDAVRLSLPVLSGGRNSFIDVPLLVGGADGLAAVDATLLYDPSILRLVAVRQGSLVSNWSLAANTTTPGEVRLSMASPGGTVSGSGTLAILEFEVVGEPETGGAMVIQSATLNDGAIEVEKENGYFTVDATYSVSGTVRFWKNNEPVENVILSMTGAGTLTAVTDSAGAFTAYGADPGNYTLTAGKTNEIAGITSYDASLILQHSAGLITLSGHAATAADVNRSALINAMDAYLVLQKAVGLIDLPFPGSGAIWVFSPEERSYSNLASNLTNQNFTAILLGDVSGNWKGSEGSPQGMTPSGATMVLHEVRVPESDQIMARVLVSNGDPVITSMDLVFSHGDNVTLENVVPGALLEGFAHAFNTGTANEIRAALAGTHPMGGANVLLTFQFRGEGPTSLDVSSYSVHEGQYSLAMGDDIAPFDSDGDGLIDIDEIEIFGTDPFNPDTTGDGIPDGLAFRLGLNPADPGSRFTFQKIERDAETGVRVSWPTKPGNKYRIEKSSDLRNWEPHGVAITADGPTTTLTLPVDTANQRFYRVVFIED